MISVNNITKEFGGEPLFSDVSFNINPKDRIGLAGVNGAGKSTLLKIFAGEIGSEKGNIIDQTTCQLAIFLRIRE